MAKNKSMLNKWDYSKMPMVCCSDKNKESYKKSAEFLGDSVEDWGCGTGWSKKYFKEYKGIDGAPHKNVDVIADLAFYTSETDNILIRQALEFNWRWREILENVKKSFRKKFCLVIMTPLVEETKIMSMSPVNYLDETTNTPDISFNKQDILDYFPKDEFIVSEESIKTNQGWGHEWILYVERRNS